MTAATPKLTIPPLTTAEVQSLIMEAIKARISTEEQFAEFIVDRMLDRLCKALLEQIFSKLPEDRLTSLQRMKKHPVSPRRA